MYQDAEIEWRACQFHQRKDESKALIDVSISREVFHRGCQSRAFASEFDNERSCQAKWLSTAELPVDGK